MKERSKCNLPNSITASIEKGVSQTRERIGLAKLKMQTPAVLPMIVMIITMLGILNFSGIPILKVPDTFAHISPNPDGIIGNSDDCTTPFSQIGLTAFRGGVPIVGTGPVVQGETIEFEASLDPAAIASRCAREDGDMIITYANQTNIIVTPVGGIPCIGNAVAANDDDLNPPDPNTDDGFATKFDGSADTVDGDDCDAGRDGDRNTRPTVVSNRISYVVDCDDLILIDGELRLVTIADWVGGFNHRVNNVNDEPAGQASTPLPLECVIGMIEWEKRLQISSTPHPLQGGATFSITLDPFDKIGSLTVVDNGANDVNPILGQIKVNGTLPGTYTVEETKAPNGCNLDTGDRIVTVSADAPNQVIGIQGVDDDDGGINERDFHDICPPQPTKITIKKDTIPNDPQDFTFTHNIPPTPFSPFILDDDSNAQRSNMKTFDNPPSGTYTVTETTVKDIPLQSIRCNDNDSIRAGNSAIIDLDAGEQITCTFTNGAQVPPCESGRLPEQPEDAISMTSIRSNSIIKTIHAEKQVFNCQLPQGSIPVIADVTIIAEIYQDINTKTILSKQVEVVTCIKDPATIRVLECNLSIPSIDRIPVTNCEELEMQHPQEMITIRKGSTAKTIETQKEVFTCTMNTPNDITDDKKVDLVLFTEIYQNLNTLTSENPTMLSMKCVIKIDTVQVESCSFRQVNS